MRSTQSVARGLFDRALDLVFPQRCVGCEAWGSLICEMCEAGMVPAAPPRCERCWMPTGGRTICGRCREWKPAFARVRAAYRYEGIVRDAVLAIKFNGLSSIAPLMAEAMVAGLDEWSIEFDAIVPVPLAGGRKRERGYDQAELIAKELSKRTGVPVETRAVNRRRSTVAQAQQGDEYARRKNVEDAFAPGRRSVDGPVLVVDDVITTGATLDAVARVLKGKGAGPVYGLAFARED